MNLIKNKVQSLLRNKYAAEVRLSFYGPPCSDTHLQWPNTDRI